MLFLAFLAAAAVDPPKKPPVTEPLRKAVIDAIRNCPKSQGDEIAVCAPDRGISEGYRVPKMDSRFARNLRPSGRGELTPAEAEALGINPCSNVGPAGGTGCSLKDYRAWRAERDLERSEKGK